MALKPMATTRSTLTRAAAGGPGKVGFVSLGCPKALVDS